MLSFIFVRWRHISASHQRNLDAAVLVPYLTSVTYDEQVLLLNIQGGPCTVSPKLFHDKLSSSYHRRSEPRRSACVRRHVLYILELSARRSKLGCLLVKRKILLHSSLAYDCGNSATHRCRRRTSRLQTCRTDAVLLPCMCFFHFSCCRDVYSLRFDCISVLLESCGLTSFSFPNVVKGLVMYNSSQDATRYLALTEGGQDFHQLPLIRFDYTALALRCRPRSLQSLRPLRIDRSRRWSRCYRRNRCVALLVVSCQTACTSAVLAA